MLVVVNAALRSPLAIVIEALRWIVVLASIPLTWVLGLMLDSILYGHAARLLCAGHVVSGRCMLPWFDEVAQVVHVVSSMVAAVSTVLVVYLLAPNSRVWAMWWGFGIGSAVLLLLLGPLHALPALLSAALIALMLARHTTVGHG